MSTEPQAQSAEALELKRCLFHKPDPDLPPVLETVVWAGTTSYWYVRCQCCEVRTQNFISDEYAIEAWNTRADLPRAAADDNLVAALAAVVIDESLPRNDGPCWCDDEYDSKGPHIERCQRIKELTRLAAATPRATETLTVGAALAELRAMEAIGAGDLAYSWDSRASQFRITIWPKAHNEAEFELRGQTLDDAMQQVRAWDKSRVER